MELNLQNLAEEGDAYAETGLGWMYHYGKGVERDLEIAVKLYGKAAKQGHATAQCNLGYCFQYGEGVELRKVSVIKCCILLFFPKFYHHNCIPFSNHVL